MFKRRKIYLGLLVIGLLSVVAVIFSPRGLQGQNIFLVSAFGSMMAGIWALIHDQIIHDRQIKQQDEQNRFLLGATSHMAIVAFDKHVLFSEEYVTEVNNTLRTLFREGPSEEVLKHARELCNLRQKYFVWLTNNLDLKLDNLRAEIRKIGAAAGYLQNTGGGADGRKEKMSEMYLKFAKLLGKENMGADKWEGKPLSDEESIDNLKRQFRVVLGIEELTKIRSSLIVKAHDLSVH